jgi:hypothetical protein
MHVTENPRAVIGGNNPPPLAAILEEKSAGIRDEVAKLAIMANRWPKTDAGGLSKIATEEDLEAASELVKSARMIAKRADEMRKSEKQPFLDGGREVDGFFGAITARLERIGAAFQGLADTFATERAAEERRRREEEAKRLREEEDRARAAAEAAKRPATVEKRTAEADAAAERATDAEAFAAAPAADLVTTTVSASGVKASAKTEWAFEITDASAVDLEPLRYLLKRDAVDAAVKQFVKNGGRQLRGVRIFEKVVAAIR